MKPYPTFIKKCNIGQLILWPLILFKLSYSEKLTNILNLSVNVFIKIASIFTHGIKWNRGTTSFNLFYVLFTNHDENGIGESQNMLLNLILWTLISRWFPPGIHNWMYFKECLNPLHFMENFFSLDNFSRESSWLSLDTQKFYISTMFINHSYTYFYSPMLKDQLWLKTYQQR